MRSAGVAVCSIAAAVGALALTAAASFGVLHRSSDQRAGEAIQHPYRLAWELLAEASQPDPAGPTRAAGWESWDRKGDVFNANGGPHWPADKGTRSVSLQARAMGAPHGLLGGEVCNQGAAGFVEEHLNYDEYRYIVAHHLWDNAGLGAWFRAGRTVDFPPGAISIKAAWLAFLQGPDLARYKGDYFIRDYYTQAQGLAALHLSSKVLPNWFWATFENVHNPCLFALPVTAKPNPYAQTDKFGYPDYTGIAPAGALPSPALRALLQRYGLGRVWWNYRLVGIQNDFVQTEGRPQVLGSSVIEAQLQGTGSASCMTCHARAQVNSAGFVPCVPIVQPSGMGFTGAPSALWFPNTRQLDFVWSFNALGPPPESCR